jgi:hypothetical protein
MPCNISGKPDMEKVYYIRPSGFQVWKAKSCKDEIVQRGTQCPAEEQSQKGVSYSR